MDVGFVKPTQHPIWLTNIVPMKEKNGQIHCCIDFREINKEYLKDEFSLPNIDILADTRHSIFSFIDGLRDYNQIKMDP